MTPIRIVLADDHAVLRAGLKALLNEEPDMEVVGEAEDGACCVDIAVRSRPHVVVLDINMPNCNGLEALADLREQVPETRVLVLTMHDDKEYLHRVVETGGAGFLLKQSAADELITAIRAIHAGGVYVSPRHARMLLEPRCTRRQGGEDPSSLYRTLSERESEIFALIAHGHTNAEIAEELFISVKTVETYRSRLMRKLRVSTRAALVRLALELGILK
jgi:two-component system response regulator NreC